LRGAAEELLLKRGVEHLAEGNHALQLAGSRAEDCVARRLVRREEPHNSWWLLLVAVLRRPRVEVQEAFRLLDRIESEHRVARHLAQHHFDDARLSRLALEIHGLAFPKDQELGQRELTLHNVANDRRVLREDGELC